MEAMELLLVIYGFGAVGAIGFIEWAKDMFKSIREKNLVGIFAGILSLVAATVIGITAKLVVFKSEHIILIIPLIIGALSPIQLGYQIIIQGVPGTLQKMFDSIGNFMTAAVEQTARKAIKKD